MTNFKEAIRSVSKAVHANAMQKGFWDLHEQVLLVLKPKEKEHDAVWSAFMAQKIQLIGDELSEANEALRDGNPDSVKAKGFSCVEEELADAVIRILDLAAHEGWDIAGAVESKMRYNKSRPHLHGRKF